MKALVKNKAAAAAELQEVAKPSCKEDQVLVKVIKAGICGTDNHIYGWDDWSASRIKPPLIFGHEFSGIIEEVGKNVKTHKVGDHVSAETHIVCGHCYQCQTGKKHVCRNATILGVDIAGCFAEYIALPAENAWKNDPALDTSIAAIQEPFGNAVHTVFAGPGVAGKTVAVFGCGPIGIMAAAVCQAVGASAVYVVDINDYRLNLAKRYNPTKIINAKEVNPLETLLAETNGHGVDVLLEMSGNEQAISQGFNALKDGGQASLLGLTPQPIKFDLNNMVVFKGATVFGISGRKMFETWYQVSDLLKGGKVDLSKVITHHFKLEEFKEAFQLMASGNCGKIVLDIA